MQAIETEYKGPTNSNGARIIARAQAGRIVVPWDHALSVEANHDAACRAFVAKMGWHGSWIRGARADGRGNVYVCAVRNVWRGPVSAVNAASDDLLVCTKGGES